eukprot:6475318-Amphidinium_carterae.8
MQVGQDRAHHKVYLGDITGLLSGARHSASTVTSLKIVGLVLNTTCTFAPHVAATVACCLTHTPSAENLRVEIGGKFACLVANLPKGSHAAAICEAGLRAACHEPRRTPTYTSHRSATMARGRRQRTSTANFWSVSSAVRAGSTWRAAKLGWRSATGQVRKARLQQPRPTMQHTCAAETCKRVHLWAHNLGHVFWRSPK